MNNGLHTYLKNQSSDASDMRYSKVQAEDLMECIKRSRVFAESRRQADIDRGTPQYNDLLADKTSALVSELKELQRIWGKSWSKARMNAVIESIG